MECNTPSRQAGTFPPSTVSIKTDSVHTISPEISIPFMVKEYFDFSVKPAATMTSAVS